MSYGVDRHLYPISIESGSNTVAWQESDGTALEATIPPDTYWAHADPSLAPERPGLYAALADAMDAASTETYTPTAWTPDGSTLTNSGLRVTAGGGQTWQWSINYSTTGGWTLDPRLLGYPATNTLTDPAVAQTGPYSILGAWQTATLFSSGDARDKVDDEAHDLEVSTDNLQNAYQLAFKQTDERTFDYRQVLAAHIRKSRANDATYADAAGLPEGDTHNAVYHLWASARELGEILTIHDHGDASDVLTSAGSYEWEVWLLQEAKKRARFSSFADRTDKGPEKYKLEWTGELVESHYDGVPS